MTPTSPLMKPPRPTSRWREAAILQAKASLAQADAGLRRAKRNLDYCTITSPVKGVIIDRRVNIGQTVVSSLNAPSLFLIAKDLTRMQVWVAVNEADIGKIHPGQPVTFTVDAFPGEIFHGEVGKIRLNASMTQNVVTYTIEIITDNSNGRLLPYLTANVQFELHRLKNVLLVPNAALRWTPSVEQVAPEFRQKFENRWLAGRTPSRNGHGSGANRSGRSEKTAALGDGPGSLFDQCVVTVGLSDGAMTADARPGPDRGDESGDRACQRAGGSDASARNPFTPQFSEGRGSKSH